MYYPLSVQDRSYEQSYKDYKFGSQGHIPPETPFLPTGHCLATSACNDNVDSKPIQVQTPHLTPNPCPATQNEQVAWNPKVQTSSEALKLTR